MSVAFPDVRPLPFPFAELPTTVLFVRTAAPDVPGNVALPLLRRASAPSTVLPVQFKLLLPRKPPVPFVFPALVPVNVFVPPGQSKATAGALAIAVNAAALTPAASA
ncbi:hypothetical protein JDN40_11460 [Rhodomicrobium vannielii ATCC 17100]|uniref:hypothetical protein n=1 Tax=Rhodomicrobium vannielii TaxID=1069 RepID=UPI00191AB66B|nr:hypothetical protein [Rhodomicrobium vannielii]MBJ7534723.1 hypothetical protein [Rhodomicrobium vannielii ATCC 17100]